MNSADKSKLLDIGRGLPVRDEQRNPRKLVGLDQSLKFPQEVLYVEHNTFLPLIEKMIDFVGVLVNKV